MIQRIDHITHQFSPLDDVAVFLVGIQSLLECKDGWSHAVPSFPILLLSNPSLQMALRNHWQLETDIPTKVLHIPVLAPFVHKVK
jgi:hypothetical protein